MAQDYAYGAAGENQIHLNGSILSKQLNNFTLWRECCGGGADINELIFRISRGVSDGKRKTAN